MTKVMVFGSFDPLHEGHKNFFAQAKKFGDFLCVVVARDENIKRTKNREPRVKEGERLKAVGKVPDVDLAILGDSHNFGKVLDEQNPDVICIGYDQSVPGELKNTLKRYKVVTLKPFRPEVFKSTLVYKKKD